MLRLVSNVGNIRERFASNYFIYDGFALQALGFKTRLEIVLEAPDSDEEI